MTAGHIGRLGVIGVVMAALVGPSGEARSETAEPVAVTVARQGWPWLSVANGHPVPMMVAGTALTDGAGPHFGTPQALAAGDFDEDGVPDLVSAYAGVGAGLLVLHRGNVDSIYPEAPEAQARRAAGTFTAAPFLPGHKIEGNRIVRNRQGVTVGTAGTGHTIGGTAASARNVIVNIAVGGTAP